MPHVVFIHGMFMNPASWQQWLADFRAHGYQCVAPAWPGHEGEPAALRANIPADLGKLRLAEVIDTFRSVVRNLPQPPVLIGHSMGGLIVQKLVAEGLAKAGVCIDSAAPNGAISFQPSFLKSNLPVLNPLKGDKPYLMPLEHFRYTFCHTMPPEAVQAAYDRFVVPESRNVARDSAGSAGKLDAKKPHAPLLFVAGELDHIIPASLNERNLRQYTDAGSIAELKQFPGRTHFICGQDGWQEVAGFVQEWLQRHVPRNAGE